MKEHHTYRGNELAITDESPLGFQEGTWIAYRVPAGWEILLVTDKGTICSMETARPLPQTAEEALARLQHEIDKDITEMVSRRAAIRLPQTDVVEQAEVVFHGWSNPDASVPVEMLMDLYNALPDRSSIKEKVREFIRTTGTIQRQAWVRAVMEREDGSLYFDDAAYSRAAHRNKQETYQRSVADTLKTLQRNLLSVIENTHEEALHEKEIEAGGRPLVPLPEYSESLCLLKENLQALGVLTRQLRGDPLVLDAMELAKRLQLKS